MTEAARVVVVMTVHNRLETTRRCLEWLDAAAASVALRRVIVDDGSTDGTSEMLASTRREGDVVVRGSGHLYWAGGMRRGLAELAGLEPYDHVLLLNDDVALRPEALAVLLETADGHLDRVVVGQLIDPVSRATTYGGYRRRSRWRPMTFTPALDPEDGPLDGMNANAVLIGAEAYRRLGGLSQTFTHALADYDYAIRANRMGIEVLLSNDWVGECPRNAVEGTWRDGSLTRRERLRLMLGPKGVPPREWATFCWRNGGVAGLPYIASPWLTLIKPAAR
jgi:GT2 family glycosyltransferase